ncbi:hypothetical protein BS78_10G205300 [Paspalum vaginatum]|nr:hypothetical protein BS78_10G205300 [Paspalum vaginatum]
MTDEAVARAGGKEAVEAAASDPDSAQARELARAASAAAKARSVSNTAKARAAPTAVADMRALLAAAHLRKAQKEGLDQGATTPAAVTEEPRLKNHPEASRRRHRVEADVGLDHNAAETPHTKKRQ